MRRLALLSVFLALPLLGCPTPATPTNPDASDSSAPQPLKLDAAPDSGGDVFDAACNNLRAHACAEGLPDNCATVMRSAQADKLDDFAPDCVAAFNDVSALRKCGITVQHPKSAWAHACAGH